MVVYDWKPQKGFCMFALAILFDHIILYYKTANFNPRKIGK